MPSDWLANNYAGYGDSTAVLAWTLSGWMKLTYTPHTLLCLVGFRNTVWTSFWTRPVSWMASLGCPEFPLWVLYKASTRSWSIVLLTELGLQFIRFQWNSCHIHRRRIGLSISPTMSTEHRELCRILNQIEHGGFLVGLTSLTLNDWSEHEYFIFWWWHRCRLGLCGHCHLPIPTLRVWDWKA
jgi:hypothetical protein